MSRRDSEERDEPARGVDGGAGVDTDAAVIDSEPAGRVRVRSDRSNTQKDSDRSGERGSLVSYFRDIAEIPTLKKEQEVLLAKEIEAATLEFREGILRIPWSAAEAVRIWQGLRSENRATGKMCESFGSGSPEGEDLGARIDAVLGRIETLLAKRDKALAVGDLAEVRKHDVRAARLLKEADLSMQIMGRMRRQLGQHRRRVRQLVREIDGLRSAKRTPRSESGRKRRDEGAQRSRVQLAELERQLGMPAAEFVPHVGRLESAYERLTEVEERLRAAQPEARRGHREGLPEHGHRLPGPDPGGQHRADPRGREVRVPARAQVLDVRRVVDPPGAHPGASRTTRGPSGIPSHVHDTLLKYYRAYNALEKKLGRDPTTTEIAEAMQIEPERAEQLQRMVREPVSLEKDVPGTDSKKVKDIVADQNPISPVNGLDHGRLERAADKSIAAPVRARAQHPALALRPEGRARAHPRGDRREARPLARAGPAARGARAGEAAQLGEPRAPRGLRLRVDVTRRARPAGLAARAGRPAGAPGPSLRRAADPRSGW